MSACNIVNIICGNVEAPFQTPFQFEVTFECLSPLAADLEWRVVYVGSADSKEYDQELESVLVGPIPVGTNKFVLETKAPDASKVPSADMLGVTVVLITCSYKSREFIRVGYYVSNEYMEALPEGVPPPSPIDPAKVKRTVVFDKPRVTRFDIDWS